MNDFDISLPGLYKDNWREAYREDKESAPRISSYQPPDGEPIPFIYKSIDFQGGQSVDTPEYPFFGLWSNEALNQKPQIITVHGYLRGAFYLQQRTAFLSALMIKTNDDTPGFFDHPLWGRFKVVVEKYNINEAANENGQCEISLTLKRAGVSLETRADIISPVDFIKPEDVALVAVEEFAKKEKDSATLLAAFGQIKVLLLKTIGKLQAPQSIINSINNEINGISNLIVQGIQSPMQLTQILINAIFSISKATAPIEGALKETTKYFFEPDNKKTAVMQFFSASNYSLPIDTVTVPQDETKSEIENLYRILNLCGAADVLIQMQDITLNKMKTYWKLYMKLEDCINLNEPDIYKAIVEMRLTVLKTLEQTAMNNELKKNIDRPVPLLYLSHYLSCDDKKLRSMNFIEDSFLISGEVSYV